MKAYFEKNQVDLVFDSDNEKQEHEGTPMEPSLSHKT